MGTKREEYRLRGGDILEIREFHDGRYGAPGQRREKKKKPTEEQMRQANEREKIRRCQLRSWLSSTRIGFSGVASGSLDWNVV